MLSTFILATPNLSPRKESVQGDPNHYDLRGQGYREGRPPEVKSVMDVPSFDLTWRPLTRREWRAGHVRHGALSVTVHRCTGGKKWLMVNVRNAHVARDRVVI